ncbi:MAG: hypothetical protein ACREDR_38575 [Blastocatellia bacterium]
MVRRAVRDFKNRCEEPAIPWRFRWIPIKHYIPNIFFRVPEKAASSVISLQELRRGIVEEAYLAELHPFTYCKPGYVLLIVDLREGRVRPITVLILCDFLASNMR